MQGFRFDFDFLKTRYDYELQRKEQLTTALTLPVAILSALGGAAIAMARSFSYREALLTRSFDLVFLIDGLALFVCLVFLAGAYHRRPTFFCRCFVTSTSLVENFSNSPLSWPAAKGRFWMLLRIRCASV